MQNDKAISQRQSPPEPFGRWETTAIGLFLSLMSPLGWLSIQMYQGAAFQSELANHPVLYTYLTTGAAIAFGTLGYVAGKREERFEDMAMGFAKASITDDLTGLFNDAHFRSRLRDELERQRRDGTILSLILIDLDHFKDINDSMGHQTGDIVLSGFGDLLEQEVRAYDIPARVGGEEFAVLLPDTNRDEALQFAERLRRCLWAREFEAADGSATFHVTASVGIATNKNAPDIDADELYHNADEALYKAKETGRDRVIGYSELQILGFIA